MWIDLTLCVSYRENDLGILELQYENVEFKRNMMKIVSVVLQEAQLFLKMQHFIFLCMSHQNIDV